MGQQGAVPVMHTFTVPVRAKPKERPRINRKTGQVFTPKTTADYEQAVKEAYRRSDGPRFDGAVSVSAHFYGDCTVVTLEALPTSGKPFLKGDTDNYVKSLLDGLQGEAFANDSQVLHVAGTRMVSDG